MLSIRKIVICLFLMMMVATMPVLANEYADITIEVDGKAVEFENPPVIKEGRTLAPLRAVFESLGLEVIWNAENQSISGKADGVDIWLQLNNPIALVNGKEVVLDVPAFVIEGRTYVPVRFLGESTGSEVGWDGDKNLVSIAKTEKENEVEVIDYVYADEMREAGFVVEENGVNNVVSYLYGNINNVAQSMVEIQYCAERDRHHESSTNQFYYIGVYTAYEVVLEKRVPVIYNHVVDDKRGISREVYNDFLSVIAMYEDEFAYNQDRIENHRKYVDRFTEELQLLYLDIVDDYTRLDESIKFNNDTTKEDILNSFFDKEIKLSYFDGLKEYAELAMISDEEFTRMINVSLEQFMSEMHVNRNLMADNILLKIEDIKKMQAQSIIEELDYEIPNCTAVGSIEREILVDRYCEAMKNQGFSEEDIAKKRTELMNIQYTELKN